MLVLAKVVAVRDDTWVTSTEGIKRASLKRVPLEADLHFTKHIVGISVLFSRRTGPTVKGQRKATQLVSRELHLIPSLSQLLPF